MWRGIDLIRSGPRLSPNAAAVATNVDVSRESNSLISRAGYKATTVNTVGGVGYFRYAQHSNTTGLDTTVKLIAGTQLQKVNVGFFKILYAGPGAVLTFSHLYSVASAGWIFTILIDGVSALAYNLGNGFDEASTKTLSDLITAANAVTGVTASTISPLSTSEPAAVVLPSIEPFSINAATFKVIACEYLTTINQPASGPTPFALANAAKGSDDFENATCYNINSVCYINTGYDEQQKYDGQKVYRSGMPMPASTFVVASIGAGGAVDTGAHTYSMFYRQYDKQGNITEGEESALIVATTTAGNNTVNLTIPNIQNTTGFNTDQVKVNGNQVAVNTITVFAGGTLKVGDPVYFINRITGLADTTRTATAIGATTVTIDGTAVNVNNNDIITAGLSIVLTRTHLGGDTPYLRTQFPNDSSAATQAFADTQADTGTTVPYARVADGYEHGLPPKGRYSEVYRGIPVIAGSLTAGNTLFWADASGPEHWPALNTDNVVTDLQDSISAVHACEDILVIGKTLSIHKLSGDLQSLDFRVDELTRQAGIFGNSSGCHLPDGSLAFMTDIGPQRIVNGQLQNVGARLLPLFSYSVRSTTPNSFIPTTSRFALRRTVGVVDLRQQKVIFFIPAEGNTSYANDNSVLLMGDLANPYADEAGNVLYPWFQWSNMNLAGGAIYDSGVISWVERRVSAYSGSNAFNVYTRLQQRTVSDYIDHNTGISFDYKSGWETEVAKGIEEPSILKAPLRLKIYSQDPTIAANATAITLKKYLEFQNYTDMTTTLNQATQAPYKIVELNRSRCMGWQYEFTHSTVYATPVITAYETEVAPSYIPGIKA